MKNHFLTAIDDAVQQILRGVTTDSIEFEEVALNEASGRVIAETIEAGINVPGYDNSAMDGFAVNTDFVKNAGIILPISQVIPAGINGTKIASGTAARIFTGAPIPLGANAVILQEDTEYDDKNYDTWFRYASSLNAVDRFKEASISAQNCIDLKSNFGGGWYEKGVAEFKSGKKTRALKYFEEANKDRDWRKLAQRKIDEINNPTRYQK